MTRHERGSSIRLLVSGFLGVFALVVWAGPAAAHVDFLGSTPLNASTVDGPVTEITLEYSGEADPIDENFAIEGAAGAELPITSVTNDGANRVVVTPADPLPTGRTKVTWALRGSDGHRLTGTITFTVAAASGTTPSTTPTTIAAVATETNTENSPAPTSEDGVSGGDDSRFDAAGSVASIGRWIVYATILFVVGALAYLVWVHRGTRREGRRIVFLIRRAAVVIVLGSVIEWIAQVVDYGDGGLGAVMDPTAWGDLLGTGFALGTACRIAGALLVLRFISIDVVAEDPIDFDQLDDLDIFGEISGAPLRTPSDSLTVEAPIRMTTRPSRVRVESGPLAFVGALLLIASETFIGHTASVEPRTLVAISDAVHLVAAGVWTAGVWLLTWTLWQRRRRGENLDARSLALKFSLLATWALVAVAISGSALAWVILPTPSALWESEFGRLLMMKVILVGVIGLFGLHNRRNLLPDLHDPDADDAFVRTIAIESVLFLAVLVVTALLVVSNPMA